jgi:anti-sigma-K factor RskA
MTDHNKFEELLPIYALGALDGDELREMEEHLKSGCTLCKEMLKENEEVLSSILYSAPTTSPSPRVKKRLFEKIKATKKEEPYITSSWVRLQVIWLKPAGLIALALLILLFISNLSLRNRLKEQEIEINNLKNQVARQNEILEFFRNPNVVIINLLTPQPNLKSRGRILWDRKHNKALFYGLNLPSVPSGKTYQLWVIADHTPVNMGIFKVDEKGNSIMKLESLPEPSKIQKFAVTLEPEGGVPLPTGEIFLIGNS